MAALHLMVGLPCSGKTTLARRLAAELPALRLTPDGWQVRLFGQDADDADHDRRHAAIEALLWGIAADALALGTDVILDFGFWTKAERDDFRARAVAMGIEFRIHYAACATDELLRRLKARNAALPAGSFAIREAALRHRITLFEPPDPEELAV